MVLARDCMKGMSGNIVEIDLQREGLSPLDRELLERREALLREGRTDDPMLRYARQFAEADEIVIAAPYWDLSFPSILKIYLEQITVAGITFEYKDGRPKGLCRAQRLTYITTSGGEIFSDFGYSYVKALANDFYGIENTVAIRAMNMDVDGITENTVLSDAQISII